MKKILCVALVLGLTTIIALAKETPCRPLKHSSLPTIKGLAYHEARKALLSAGWRPLQTYFPQAKEDDQGRLWGNGEFFWQKGYVELENCSGTGLARCDFLFKDAYENRLRVSTYGEEGEEGENFHARVDRVFFVCKKNK